MTINVSPTAVNLSHHILLTDSSNTELGLICADSQGNRVARVTVNPYPTMASQLRQGRGKHSDRVPPFEDIALSDFSGGMAMLHHDEDASKYLEGYRMDTSQQGRVMLGGEETYTTGIRDFSEMRDIRAHWLGLDGSPTSATSEFVASAIDDTSYEADKVVVWLKKTGSPTGNVTVNLLSSADAVLKTKTFAAASAVTAPPYEVEFDWTGTETLTHGTTYKIQVAYTGTSTNYVSVFCEFAGVAPHFRVLDNTSAYNILPFEYRGGVYCVTQPEDRSNSKLYQLGTRGLADANTGALTRLNDATKNFSSAGYTVASGDLVKIIAGPGSEEDQPWRTATLGYDGYIVISPAWSVEHTVNTEYVVITDEWELLDSLDYYCTDVAVTDRIIHLAGGPDDVHHRIRFGNDDGTWTFQGDIGVSEVADTFYSDKLLAIRHDGYKSERPVFDLYSSSLQEHTADLNTTNAIKNLRTPPFWGEPFYLLGTLTDGAPWVTNEYPNTDQYSDKGFAAIEWDATFTTGSVAAKYFDTPIDISEAEFILFAMKSDTAITAAHLTLTLGDGGDTWVLNFPAITTGDDMHDDFYWYSIALHADATPPTGSDFPDLTKIDRLIIKVATDQNAIVKLKIGQDGLLLATRNPNNERYELGLTERVNNMVEYGGGAGQVTRKPWVGTNKNVYYIENGQLKPIYLKEIEELEHYRNCEGMTVNDVYLYFNLGKKIQRYYSGHLDNIGPDADYGLPEARQGTPCSMASYPGRVLAALDAEADGTSSVIYRKNHGWHEFYRAPLVGERIRQIHIVARDDTTDRVYISEGSDILWVPISLSPELDTDYRYPHFGSIITSRIYGGLRETEKYFHALTTVREEHAVGTYTDHCYIYIDYRTSELSTWTNISDSFTTMPIERNSLVSTNDTKGRWLQLRIRFEGDYTSESAELISVIIDAVERLDVNDTYTYTVELKEGTTLDLAEVQETQTGVEKLTQLETWVDSPLPLTLNTCSEFEDGKLVFLEGVRKRVLYHTVDDKEQEVRLADLTLIEVT